MTARREVIKLCWQKLPSQRWSGQAHRSAGCWSLLSHVRVPVPSINKEWVPCKLPPLPRACSGPQTQPKATLSLPSAGSEKLTIRAFFSAIKDKLCNAWQQLVLPAKPSAFPSLREGQRCLWDFIYKVICLCKYWDDFHICPLATQCNNKLFQ